MRLSQALASQVSDRTRSRGAAYFSAGSVTHTEFLDGILQATVSGSDTYHVWIEPLGPLLRASCTCPYFFDRIEICKHIWAALLDAEARALPLLAPNQAPHGVYLEPVDFDDPADLDDAANIWGDPADDVRHPLPAVSDRHAPEKRRTPPAWRTLLDSIVAASALSAPPDARLSADQLLYVIDIAASLAANAIVIELMTRVRKANGDWGKPKPARVTSKEIRMLSPGPDRQMLERLLGARPHYDWGAFGEIGELSRLRLHGVLIPETLPLLCATGRCMARLARSASGNAPDVPGSQVARHQARHWRMQQPRPEPPALLPLAWDAGPPWRFLASIRRDEAAGVYLIQGSLAREEQQMDVSEPLLALADGVLVTRNRAARLDHGGAFAWLAALRQTSPITVPLDGRPSLVDALIAHAPLLGGAPPELRVEIEEGRPRPWLRLTPVRHYPDRLEAELFIEYGDLHVPSAAPQPLVRTLDATRVIRRDLNAERQFLATLHGLGFRPAWNSAAGAQVLQVASHALPRVVRTLVAGDWHVEAAGVTYRQPGRVALHVTSGIDWFELNGQVDYGDQRVPLPSLLAAVKRGDRFVTLDDGTQGLMPEEWLQKHGMLARLASVEGDRLRFKPSQVALLDALLAAQPAATCDDLFSRARRELLAFDSIVPEDPPPSFSGTLRGYQRDGLGWLLFLRRFGFGGCLADDMGLGKTVMVLALLAHLRATSAEDGARRPALVVAPRSLVFNWRQEAGRFTPHLRVLEYTGGGRAELRDQFPEYDLVLTTYGTLRRDAPHLAPIPLGYVILDEAQAIKNAASASAKATRLLAADHRLALSGTPIENHVGELWSLFEFLNPGVLGKAGAFERAGEGSAMDADAMATLARGLRPFILRRTKDQVAPELPPKTEQTVYCELEKPQRALYDELRSHYRQTLLARVNGAGLGRAKLQVLEALLRLRQAACHPGLIDPQRKKEASAKLDVLLPHITQAVEGGHKTLVFSQFTSLLAILRERLDADRLLYEYLDGHTRDRESKVARFQSDADCRLFLVSLKAGGVGLNLTAAEYVFLLDPWWNPAVEAQAIDRAHRIGQARHVFAYRLIAKDTVEERVLELQQSKRQLADAILSADGSLIRDLKREDLELLLS